MKRNKVIKMFETRERKNRARVYKRQHESQWKRNLKVANKTILIALAIPCILIAILDPRNWIMIAGLLLISPLLDRK